MTVNSKRGDNFFDKYRLYHRSSCRLVDLDSILLFSGLQIASWLGRGLKRRAADARRQP